MGVGKAVLFKVSWIKLAGDHQFVLLLEKLVQLKTRSVLLFTLVQQIGWVPLRSIVASKEVVFVRCVFVLLATCGDSGRDVANLVRKL